jgi:hypothetical protein
MRRVLQCQVGSYEELDSHRFMDAIDAAIAKGGGPALCCLAALLLRVLQQRGQCWCLRRNAWASLEGYGSMHACMSACMHVSMSACMHVSM